MKKPIKAYASPRISVNKLAEFVHSTNPSRRRRIIHDAKFPIKAIVARYNEIPKIIKDFVESDCKDISIINDGIRLLKTKTVHNDKQEEDRDLSIKVLELLHEVPFPEMSKMKIERIPTNVRVDIEGVSVSIYPDIIFSGIYKSKPSIGGMKIHISKINELSEEASKTVSLLLYRYLAERTSKLVVPEWCYSIDIFKRKCMPSTKSFKRRMGYINDACKDIAILWDSISF